MKKYGIHAAYCWSCKWLNISGKAGQFPESQSISVNCDVCHQELWSQVRDDVACVIMHVSEQISRAVQKEAEKHGLAVYQISKNRYVLLEMRIPCVVQFGDKTPSHQARAYMQADVVCGPADWQTVVTHLKEKTSPIPEYLFKKDKE